MGLFLSPLLPAVLPMPDSFPSPRLQRPARRLAVFAMLLGSCAIAVPVMAGPEPGSGRSSLTPEQAAKVFPEHRTLALKDRRARIAILQQGERCIGGAGNPDALSNCLREERGAMMRQRQEYFGAMRSLYQRLGLPAPEWKMRRNRGGWGGEGQQGAGSAI